MVRSISVDFHRIAWVLVVLVSGITRGPQSSGYAGFKQESEAYWDELAALGARNRFVENPLS
ncbi:MAG: hypothetical protein U9Q21_04980 [Candidatus Auribacterota bacterium]|nr:hypothetical protein [Candidatus Auribacterota bacterium]